MISKVKSFLPRHSEGTLSRISEGNTTMNRIRVDRVITAVNMKKRLRTEHMSYWRFSSERLEVYMRCASLALCLMMPRLLSQWLWYAFNYNQAFFYLSFGQCFTVICLVHRCIAFNYCPLCFLTASLQKSSYVVHFFLFFFALLDDVTSYP